MEKANLKKDYFWNTLGVFAQNATSPLLLIAITRINGIYDSGLFSFAFSVAAIFWSLNMWGGRTYQVSDVKAEFEHRSYITMRIILSIIVVVAAAIFSIVNHYDTTKTLTILLLVTLKAFESIADSLYGVLQINDKLYVAGRSLTYKAALGLVVFAAIYALTKDILLASGGLLLVNVILVLAYDMPRVIRVEDIYIQWSSFKRYARESLTIMQRTLAVFAISFLAIFSLNIPRYFIDLYHNDVIGYFGILAMPVTLIVLLMSFILQPNIVGLARLYGRKKYAQFKREVNKILLATATISGIVLLASYGIGIQILEFLFGVSFYNYKLVLMIILIGAIANAFTAIYMNMLTIMRRFKVQFYILLISNIVLVALSAMFVKPYGMLGGITLYAAVNIVQLGLFYFMFNRQIRKAGNE